MSDTKEVKKSFSVNDLKDTEKKDFTYVTERILELRQSRVNHYGMNLDKLWAEADRDYVPHRLKTKSKRMVVTDEDKGWRGALVNLGSSDWQSDVSQSNPFVKIQIALAILIDQNPTGVFSAALKKFQATTDLIKQLYQRSWEVAKSKAQLKLFVFNLAKYGWAIARTYPYKLTRKTRVIKDYNPDKPDETTYEEKDVVVYNDIMRENLDPRNTWIDDMAKPNNEFSIRDWCWRKVYDMDVAKEEFGKYKLWKYVQAGGTVTETVSPTAPRGSANPDKQYQSKNLVEVYFYENVLKDLFMVIANGVPVIISPLPISDDKGNKKLSCWQAYWNLRHAESPYGIGIYEAIRFDQAMLDRVRNMTTDQLTLSIYKMWFHQGTQTLDNTGDIRISPGVGKQVMDPKNITWLEVPGPGAEAWEGIEMFRKDIDEGSGITDPLMGNVTGKTAFEISQAKEAALKRLKNPLENILDALNLEGYITINLIQLLYSIPEVYTISDPQLISDYLHEINGDPELYEREETIDENGIAQSTFTAKVFPEFPLNLDKDEQGNLIETKETQFFRVKPRFLTWEGVINIKAQSILTPSKQVDKTLDLEMYNMLIPLLERMAQERMMLMQAGQPVNLDDLTTGKTAKSIIKLYDKDPKDILPDAWLQETPAAAPPEEELIIPAGGAPEAQGPQSTPPAAPTMIPQQKTPNMAQKFMSKIGSVFK